MRKGVPLVSQDPPPRVSGIDLQPPPLFAASGRRSFIAHMYRVAPRYALHNSHIRALSAHVLSLECRFCDAYIECEFDCVWAVRRESSMLQFISRSVSAVSSEVEDDTNLTSGESLEILTILRSLIRQTRKSTASKRQN